MDSKADTDSEHASTTAAAASTGKASVDSLSQRFSLFNTTTTNTSTSAANTSKPSKGPLGLSTLHEPQGTVVADLIFVHGLGGGSHNTWRAHGDSALYWPEWLPTEEDFRDVRIHSFGYNSNWDKESILGIHDFARSLLGSIVDSPSISPRDHAPILFVAHSMGGLVIKRLYTLARSNPEYESLATRILAMFFLATPHQGADLAKTLDRLLSFGGRGARPFVQDLRRQSAMVTSLNDEFPRHCQDLRLFSFFETLSMDVGFRKALIVDRTSAILGYKNERVDYLDANHKNMCKYTSKDDPNYKTVRNSIAGALRNIRQQRDLSEKAARRDKRRLLDGFLGVQDNPEDDFIAVDERRMSGSCEWLIRKESFQSWVTSEDSSVYCLAGKPGRGKSIVTGKVISHLKERGLDCSFYFFRYQTKSSSNIANFLLSLTRQLAIQDEQIFKAIVEAMETDENLRQRNYRTIWSELFLKRILLLKSEPPNYIVLDALDECQEEDELIPLLLKAAEMGSLHIFFTTRNPYKPGQLRAKVITEEILEEDSGSDISLFLEANINLLPVISMSGQEEMISTILAKSQGNFLWTRLVFQELRNVYTSAGVKKVLDQVPSDMNKLYARILDSMSVSTHDKPLAKAMITWIVCAARPLSTMELSEALKFNPEDAVGNIMALIQACCGDLLYVDAQSMVRLVHLTAHDYLLDAGISSEFAVDKKGGHRQLLLTCLRHLTFQEQNGARVDRTMRNKGLKTHSPFERYASESLDEHLRHLSWSDKDVTEGLVQFFKSANVLSWIEYIATYSDLSRLIDMGEALGEFADGIHDPGVDELENLVMLRSWATDLARLVMEFGGNLKAYPASVFKLIPPFCPTNTMPRKQFGSVSRGITVRGVAADTWGDCLSTIHNPNEHFSSIASSKHNLAIGCRSGRIMVYEHFLNHQFATLDHLETVRILRFGDQEDILASAGSKIIRIWDIASKTELWNFDAAEQCMALDFTHQSRHIMTAMKDHHLKIRNLEDGSLVSSANWTMGVEYMTLHVDRQPTAAAFSIQAQLLAIAYKGQDLIVWDIEGDCLYDVFTRDDGATGYPGRQYRTAGVRCLEFGTGPSADLLAAAYMDGELLVFNLHSGEVRKGGVDAFCHILSCSPDGTKLATADPSGGIKIFQFETLDLLYQINSIQAGIDGFIFSSDGRQLLDVRGSRARIWGPAVLARHNRGGGSLIHNNPQQLELKPPEDTVHITSIACHDGGRVFFCGKQDGSVHLFDIESGLSISTLFSHGRGANVSQLQYHHSTRTITSVGYSSNVLVHQLTGQDGAMVAGSVILKHRAEFVLAIRQVVSRPDLKRFLLGHIGMYELLSISEDGRGERIASLASADGDSFQWANHPVHLDQLLLVTRSTLRIFEWHAFKEMTPPNGIQLDAQIPFDLSPRYIKPIFGGRLLAVMYNDISRPLSNNKIVLYETTHLDANAGSLLEAKGFDHLCSQAVHLIGLVGSDTAERLVFLQKGNWVSAVSARGAMEGRVGSHFFFPAGWMSADHQRLIIDVTRQGDVVLVKRDEVAVVRRGLNKPEFEKTGSV